MTGRWTCSATLLRGHRPARHGLRPGLEAVAVNANVDLDHTSRLAEPSVDEDIARPL
ncbi:MAG TPA: hypothetical protein VKA58_11320 [Propionibacteriaceae bacterium]|nr:hypothetical protein [Propionibacteriaceae bacterium]